MVITITWEMIGVLCVAIPAAGGAILFFFDSRYVKRSSFHDHANNDAKLISLIQEEQIKHSEKIANSAENIIRTDELLRGIGNQLSDLKNQVSEMNGYLKAKVG